MPASFFLAVTLTAAAAVTAVMVSVSGLLRPQPRPIGYSPIKQSIPPRHFAYGRGRKPGAYLYYASVSGFTLDVLGFCHGRIGGNWQFYFHDDPVTLNIDGTSQAIDGRYGNPIIVKSQNGAATGTAFDHIVEKAEGTWTSAHRADHTAAAGMRCAMVAQDKMLKIYPNQAPALSAEADWLCVYDWRKDSTAGGSGAHRRNNPATWEFSENPIVCQVHDEWATNYPLWSNADTALANREKAIADRIWARRFAPSLDVLTEEADACDETVALAAGGTIARYTCFVWYEATSDRKSVREMFRLSCDGWRSERADGSFVIRCGRWLRSPTPISAAMIVDIDNLTAGIAKSRLVNELQVRFRSPEHLYEIVDTIPWTDEASITKRGRKTAALELGEVTNNSQARRLGKARFYALNAEYSGEIVLDLDSLPADFFDYRFHELQLDEGPTAFQSMDLEIVRSEMDLFERTVRVTVRSANSAMYDWDAETEEGSNPGVIVPPSPVELAAPTITTVTPFFEDTGSGTGVRLNVVGTGPDRSDLIWYVRWRVDGASSWVEGQFADADPSGGVEIDTGFVTANETLEVQIAYETGGGELSPWGPTTPATADTSIAAAPPAMPTGLSAVDNGTSPNGATVQWSNGSGVTHARVYIGGVSDAFPGTGNSGDLAATSGTTQTHNYVATAGTYRIWVTNKNAAGESDPAGPVTVTVV